MTAPTPYGYYVPLTSKHLYRAVGLATAIIEVAERLAANPTAEVFFDMATWVGSRFRSKTQGKLLTAEASMCSDDDEKEVDPTLCHTAVCMAGTYVFDGLGLKSAVQTRKTRINLSTEHPVEVEVLTDTMVWNRIDATLVAEVKHSIAQGDKYYRSLDGENDDEDSEYESHEWSDNKEVNIGVFVAALLGQPLNRVNRVFVVTHWPVDLGRAYRSAAERFVTFDEQQAIRITLAVTRLVRWIGEEIPVEQESDRLWALTAIQGLVDQRLTPAVDALRARGAAMPVSTAPEAPDAGA